MPSPNDVLFVFLFSLSILLLMAHYSFVVGGCTDVDDVLQRLPYIFHQIETPQTANSTNGNADRKAQCKEHANPRDHHNQIAPQLAK